MESEQYRWYAWLLSKPQMALLLADGLWNQLLDQLTQLHLEFESEESLFQPSFRWRLRLGSWGSQQRMSRPVRSGSEAPALLASCIAWGLGATATSGVRRGRRIGGGGGGGCPRIMKKIGIFRIFIATKRTTA